MSAAPKAFITYSHNDKEARKELRTRLAVMENKGEIELWDDNEILPGDEWYKDIADNLSNSDILLYLVSAASLASKNCNKELAEALRTDTRVVPIILEACDWENHQLSRFEVLPDKGRPINTWKPESEGWQNVVEGIRKTIHKMQGLEDSSSKISEKELSAELAFQQGNVLVMFGQFDTAIEAYTQAIKLNSNHADAYGNRGIVYHSKGEFVRAIKNLNRSIQLNPNCAITYHNRGVTYHIVDSNRAIQLIPNLAEAYNNRGNAYNGKSEYNRAIEDYNKAIQLKPDFTEAHNNRGWAYNGKGKYDRAIEDYNRAIKIDPNNTHAYLNRGMAYMFKGKYRKAISDHNKAIQINPHDVKAYTSRGAIYMTKGKYDRAMADYAKAIQINPNYSDVYNNRGLVYVAKGKHNRAIIDYNRAIQLNPNYGMAYGNRGVAWLHLGEWDRAREDLKTANNIGMDIIAAFQHFYEGTYAFEDKHGLQLPADIATMLTTPKA